MKLIIAGSRNINLNIGTIQDIFDNLFSEKYTTPDEVVSGAAKGVDQSGENWAEFQNIPIKKFKADWDKYGKKAGPIRNKEMAKYADALLLIWDGESRGSFSMKSEMEKLKKPIFECILKKEQYE